MLDSADGMDSEPCVIRRPAPRVAGAAVATGEDVRLEPFGPVTLVNLSETGALVEAATRPSVGSPVQLALDPERAVPIGGRVVRTRVATLHADETMSYQLGIAFDAPTQVSLKPGIVRIRQHLDTLDSAPELASRPPRRGGEPINQW